MDKVAYYEEMILNDVLEKTAGATSRFLRNVYDTNLEAVKNNRYPMDEIKLPKLRAEMKKVGPNIPNSHIDNVIHNAQIAAKGDKTLKDYNNSKTLRYQLGWKPYKGNTGLTGKRTERLNQLLEKNNKK